MAAVPDPPDQLDLEVETWPAGQEIVRVYTAIHGPLAFNASPGHARFRPVHGVAMMIVPTLYGAAEVDAAFAETVLHDLSPKWRRSIPSSRVEHRAVSRLLPTRDLRLVALHGYGLRQAGVERRQLIDTPPRAYPQTAKWGQAIHDHPEQVDGILWMSRQFDSQKALLLWGGRVRDGDLVMVGGSTMSLLAGRGFELASEIALRAGFARINRR